VHDKGASCVFTQTTFSHGCNARHVRPRPCNLGLLSFAFLDGENLPRSHAQEYLCLRNVSASAIVVEAMWVCACKHLDKHSNYTME
jgi:hypothetical protein